MREGVANSGSELKVDEGHVKDALEGVAAEPEPQRRRRPLAERGEEDAGGDDDEGEVPDHVEHEHRPRVRALAGVAVTISVVVGSAVGAVGEEEAAAGGGDEAREGEGAHRGEAEHGISSSAADVALLLVHVREEGESLGLCY